MLVHGKNNRWFTDTCRSLIDKKKTYSCKKSQFSRITSSWKEDIFSLLCNYTYIHTMSTILVYIYIYIYIYITKNTIENNNSSISF